tara:strand:+ start:2047 stop:2835 length:789 start_codon:yes stop_codon:yes gene_type:complete
MVDLVSVAQLAERLVVVQEVAGSSPVVHPALVSLCSPQEAEVGMSRFTVYKTTNMVNGRFYVGAHRTENPHDNYLGSGSALTGAIKKYGRTSFVKAVLFDFDNPGEMGAKEAEIVDVDFVDNPMTYNLVPGGHQGNSYYRALEKVSSEDLSAWCTKGNEVQRQMAVADPTFRDPQRKAGSRVFKKLHSEGRLRHDTFTGRKHSEESKAKMRESSRITSLGKRNSQYGTVWVCREGSRSRKVKKDELCLFIKEGWHRGRKIKP